MSSIIKNATALSREEIEALYAIHKKVYFDRGIGHPKEIWLNNLLKMYHNTSDKKVQLFSYEHNSSIDGYTITAGPIFVGNKQWYKIVEAGACQKTQIKSADAFTKLIRERLNCTENKEYTAEIDKSYKNIIALSIQAGFDYCRDKNIAYEIMRRFIGDNVFKILNDKNGIIVNRDTITRKNYEGRILTHIHNNDLLHHLKVAVSF
ncbi:MAG: hypothetical protein KJ583_03710 [Nanoarchaeota archaeon]|nr:hypothetical protein [Nanoarchaeota archaeon]MBU1604399.1 hypothetical protein [Nanoarchaeota archaeon]MBU2443260.1 hypothetical protein [Nanoarchaeota archaeon]